MGTATKGEQVKIPRLYSGDDGQSHWGEAEIDTASIGPAFASEVETATGAQFFVAVDGGATPWHTAPHRAYVVSLEGEAEYEIGDGTRRHFGPGDIFLVEDRTGQGHITRFGESGPRKTLHVVLPD